MEPPEAWKFRHGNVDECHVSIHEESTMSVLL